MNEALNTKEHKKVTDHTQLLFPGGGPHVLTDPMFIEKVSDDKAVRLERIAAQAEGLKKRSRAKKKKVWEQMGRGFTRLSEGIHRDEPLFCV